MRARRVEQKPCGKPVEHDVRSSLAVLCEVGRQHEAHATHLGDLGKRGKLLAQVRAHLNRVRGEILLLNLAQRRLCRCNRKVGPAEGGAVIARFESSRHFPASSGSSSSKTSAWA